jgi:DNA primase
MDGLQRWHCFTNCPSDHNDGDAIAFYMRWRQVDFKIALDELARRAGIVAGSAPVAATARPAHAEPSMPVDPPLPDATWQARALDFCGYANRQLWEESGSHIRTYLHDQRFLSDETIRAWGLGYNPRVVRDEASRWGLKITSPVWCSSGVVIPGFYDGGLAYVKVRRLDGDDPKYAGPAGGRAVLFGMRFWKWRPTLLLTEGEFDAILAWQELGDLVDVATLGAANNKARTLDLLHLASYRRIFAAYDADKAGNEGRVYVASLSGRVTPVTPPAHDITDAYREIGRAGLRQWLQDALQQQEKE